MINKFLTFALFLSVFFISCTNDSEVQTSKLDKTNSVEYKNLNFFLNEDGTTSKYENEVKLYDIVRSTEVDYSVLTSENNKKIIRVNNLITSEYIDLYNIIEEDNYITFDAKGSNNRVSLNFKLYNKDLLNILKDENLSYRAGPGPWVPIIKTLVETVIESFEDTEMEQCRKSRPTNCPPGQSPYMEFSSSWFSTTCNVGCR